MPQLRAASSSRSQFRPYALDGAMLYFHPESGTHVRVANATTRARRREAPRVAMFGITNACNLACAFCSRDVGRDSLWTVASAAAMLRGLADAGTLEVAFGGGEPFAFRGFADLLAELHATTALAMHVTTNGTLVREAMWRRLRGLFGQVRMSIYPEVRWQDCADLFAASGQRWGANVLVDDAALLGLPGLITELATRRCHDVSLLSYVGPDRRRQLSSAGEQRLADIIAGSAVPCRLSVCFGDRVPVPRLFAGIDNTGDCGAGYDFVSITPDQRVQSCSFQDHGLPAATADEVLDAWRQERARLAQPSPRDGCARRLPVASAAPPLPNVAVWQAFSGNNSGECILVAKFETVERAETFVAELLPGWVADEPYSATWRDLFARERVSAPSSDEDRASGLCPRELEVIGASVLALSYDAGDAFPDLRALAWKRDAYVAPGGIHVHDGITLLAAVRGRDGDDARALMKAPLHGLARRYLHGDRVLAVIPFLQPSAPATLGEAKHLLASFAAGRAVAAELYDEAVTDDDLIAVKQRLGDDPKARSRLYVSFYGQDAEGRDADAQARAFAASLGEDRVLAVANGVLVDPVARRKRAAVLAYRRGGYVQPLDGEEVRICASFWFDAPPAPKAQKGRKAQRAAPILVSRARLETALGAALPRTSRLTVVSSKPDAWRQDVTVTVDSAEPGAVMTTLRVEAARLGCKLRVSVREIQPLAWTVRRLIGR